MTYQYRKNEHDQWVVFTYVEGRYHQRALCRDEQHCQASIAGMIKFDEEMAAWAAMTGPENCPTCLQHAAQGTTPTPKHDNCRNGGRLVGHSKAHCTASGCW